MVSSVTILLTFLHTFYLSGSYYSVSYFGKINMDQVVSNGFHSYNIFDFPSYFLSIRNYPVSYFGKININGLVIVLPIITIILTFLSIIFCITRITNLNNFVNNVEK